MSVPNMEFFQINIFALLDKICKMYKAVKIQGNGCYDISTTFISPPKDGLLEFAKFEFWHVSSFSCI